ncbi:DnaB-like helicase C-terminal domain-containing protein [[Mycoplasma] anseris]|uniref:SF4 helicase domain-containing protein n=1 Tax=[Mycoplasma] anseris TaxID=92400 RepID=A0A2Z4NDN3_9BACT|nr:DnaB-like helicase C-terminal domain-containing protein [[Mycoplasma] anseris]AWX69703.1 hypothetical protein DP065_03030 [[Mycoplasma] anseris]
MNGVNYLTLKKHMALLKSIPQEKLLTHFKSFDKVTNGLQKDKFYILAARPSVGKTTFVTNIAINVNNQRSDGVVLFISLEMTAMEMAKRLKQTKRIIKNPQNLIFIDLPSLTIEGLEKEIKNFVKENKKINLIVIDHIQLLNSSRASKNKEYEKVSYISRSLKVIAQTYNIPILAVSQLSREFEKRTMKAKYEDGEPMLSDLRDSGTIEQDADVVAFIWNYIDIDENKKILKFTIKKNRHGKHANGFIKFNLKNQTMKEIKLDMEKEEYE